MIFCSLSAVSLPVIHPTCLMASCQGNCDLAQLPSVTLYLHSASFASSCTIVMASALARPHADMLSFGSHPYRLRSPYHGLTLSGVFRSHDLSFTSLLWARMCALHDADINLYRWSRTKSVCRFELRFTASLSVYCVYLFSPPQHFLLKSRVRDYPMPRSAVTPSVTGSGPLAIACLGFIRQRIQEDSLSFS